jgi:hypothetical protein
VDEQFLAAVLRVYRPNCRYLKRAEVVEYGDLAAGVPVVMRGDFVIDESCYIDDTGHFNAVEFNICYNQMLYLVVASLIEAGAGGPLRDWSMDDFWLRQLPQFLIADFHSTFRRAMRDHQFYGEIRLTRAVRRGPSAVWPSLLVLYTECEFGDTNGPSSYGRVKVVLLDPPGDGA